MPSEKPMNAFVPTFKALGDEQKGYEAAQTRYLTPGIPIIVRADGRAFHSFCRGLERPFDERLQRSMIETARYLLDKTAATIAYTQSDEITLVFALSDPLAEMPFGGVARKIETLCAAGATAAFNREIASRIPEKSQLLPEFDARCAQVPNLQAAFRNLLWRETDATRNSLSMAAQAHYSQKELQGAKRADLHEMLHRKGVNWSDYPAAFKRGTFLRRETILKELTPAELERIPEGRRPSGPIERSEIREVRMPPLNRLSNPIEALFFGAAPAEMALAAESPRAPKAP